ncbi:MAG TPA: hypothetical protein PLQ56_13600 [Aggregatilineales bacterium]|nr:hypothetical protein [Aggregatilineales bacterium]
MLRRLPLFILTALLIVAALLSLIALPRQSTTADDSAATLMALLESRLADGKPVTLQFERPFLGGETLLTLPDAEFDRQLSSVGADYLCISEPWNNTRRIHCTPFANLVSASYED